MDQKIELQEKIEHYDRDAVKKLISAGVLKLYTEEQERNEICRNLIMELKDLSIVDLMVKEEKITLCPDMFDLNTNYHGKEIISKVIGKYLKEFDLEDSEVCDWIFIAACKTGNYNIAKKMLQRGHGFKYLDQVASAGMDFYEMAFQVKKENIPDETVVNWFVESARQSNGELYLKLMLKNGFDIETCTEDGLTAYKILEQASQVKPKNKKEINELHMNQEGLLHLKRVLKEREEKEGKKEIRRQSRGNNRKLIMGGIIAAIVAVVVILAAVRTYQISSDTADTSTVSVISEEQTE